ncbi:hypothetical protein AAC387_Pa12g1363 [Persea americana]
MKIFSWNVRGLGGAARRLVVKETLRSNKVQIALIQETKLSSMSNKIVREVWGSKYLRWIAIDAVGSAGGILLLWDSRYVVVSNTAKGEFSVSAEVEDLVINKS